MQSVSYDSIAQTYERRYQHNQYDGVERELLRFVGSEPTAVLEVGCGTGHPLCPAPCAAGPQWRIRRRRTPSSRSGRSTTRMG